MNPKVDLKVHERAKKSVANHMLNTIGVRTKNQDPEVTYQQVRRCTSNEYTFYMQITL